MPACRARSGFSLLEVLLAGALALLALTLLVQVLVPSMKLVAENSVRTGLQQQGRNALDRMERDLRLSEMDGITLQQNPPALAINRVQEGPFTGTVIWEPKFVIYFRDSNQRLVRKECPPGPPTPAFSSGRATACSAADLGQLVSTVNGSESWLASGVQAFSASVDSLGAYTLSLSLSQADPSGRTDNFVLSRTIYLRNH